MRFIDLTTKYHITRDRLYSAISISCILLVSGIGVLVTKTALDTQAQNDRIRRQEQAERLAAATTESVEETTTTSESAETSLVPVIALADDFETVEPLSSDTPDTEESTEEDVSYEEETTTVQTTTEATTTAGHTETEMYMTVYASGELNLRTGPGTEYDLVRVLEPGDAIDVVAVTDNGWYRTYNGNYVSSSHTTTTPPVAPSTVPQTEATAAPTAAPTTTAAPVETQGPAPAGATNTCTITFYGPQPRADGSYSTTTATGSTCSQGRTCAADWSIYPPGTVIYVANDPLGGDGYYTVEDCGPGVTGYHIDIYVDDVSSYSTTSRDVSVA